MTGAYSSVWRAVFFLRPSERCSVALASRLLPARLKPGCPQASNLKAEIWVFHEPPANAYSLVYQNVHPSEGSTAIAL